MIGLDPTILALIIAPIATELPEKFNSVLWVRTGKDTLAMGNITGAMVFQSCVPTVLGAALHRRGCSRRRRAISLPVGRCRFRLRGPDLPPDAAAAGACSAWTLLIGGPLYLIYVYLALFTPLGVVGNGH